MSRHAQGRDAALADIRRAAERERRERAAQDRATAGKQERDDEDRRLRRARMRAAFRAPVQRREAVADAWDRVEAEVLWERIRARSAPPPAIDFDFGRGVVPEAAPTPTWRNPSGG
jgi:hypothetical protein